MLDNLQTIAEITAARYVNCKDSFGREDLQQEIMIALCKVASEKHCNSYYFRKAEWTAHNFLKSQSRYADKNTDTVYELAEVAMPDFSNRVILHVDLDLCAKTLPVKLHSVFTLFIHGYTPSEISNELGLSVQVVRKQIRKIRQHTINFLGVNYAV